ncbi:E3 ubiquitin-protein ligase SHPRH-like isoform X1 [Haliotis cracherodii]|uniref:E3 ubiquitin-protein ligase SHPRH-like isoform X1 n=2 Tax=Haliotis cracherodii TaxID=6455 RepID=UPI0039E899CE
MSKRKGNIPQKVDEEKRKCLSWNMMDGVEDPQGSSAIFGDGQSEILPQYSFEDGLPDIAQEITLGNEEVCVKDSFSYTEHLFYFHLDYCSFFVSIMDRLHTKDGNWSCEIGRFELQVEPEPSSFSLVKGFLPQCEECWLYVADPGHRNMLYFELDDNDENLNSNGLAKRNKKYPQFWFASVSLPTVCLKALQVKAYQMVRGKFDPASKVLEVIIYAKETVLMKPQFPSENIRPNKITRATTVLMGHFYGFEPDFNFDGLSRTEKYDFDKLFEGVKKCHIERIKSLCVDVQHPCLKPVLRQYQRQAVTWMLSQERYHDGTTHTPAHTGPALHFLYAEVTMKDGKVLYYNKHNGVLVMKRPLMSSWPPGGLLADEMGLGKTVEVLSCVLLHPRTSLPRPQKLSFSCDQEEITTLEHSKIGLHNFRTDPPSVGFHQDNQNTELTSVTMSDNPTSVASHQYNQNTELTSVTMNDNPTSVGSHQYNQNTELTSVTMSDNPTSVGSHQYNQNTELTLVTMSDNPPSVGSHQYNQNTELTLVTMSDNPPSVGSHQYNQNTELTLVTMSDNPPSVGSHQYNQNTELTSVTMSDNPPSVSSHQYNQNTELMSGISSGCMKAMDENTKPKVLVLSTHICEVSEHENGSNSSIHNSKSMSNEDVICDMDCHDSGALSSNESDVQSIRLPGQPTADKVLRRRKNKRLTFGKKKRMMITADVARKTKALNKSGKSEKNMKFHVLVEENGFKPATFFINTHISQKQWFECVCGGDANDRQSKKKKLTNVQCVVCGLWQHAQCLHYDLNNAYRGCYKCPHCHVSSSPIPSGATLIISPFSICHQWKEEIKKHVRQETLHVFVYTGVSKQGFTQPQTLADCDVVITTYETLRKEIDYVDLPHSNSSAGRRFRHRKRFMAIPSPIIAVEWWRICLDEAQMVECTTTKTAEMALRLSGVNRWCVTGTPIQKSVQDLYGLLLFLGMDPYWVQLWWNRLLYQPFSYGITQPMYDTLSQALWRTAKRDVLDQIQLPPQSQAVHWLTFSPVEDHFYRRQYRDCAKEAAQKLCKWTDSSVKLSSMDRHTMSQLMQPLLRLRQACCHPQAVRGEFLPIHKNTMTMEELLESLTRKAKLESEEAHRQFIAALNGLAALCIIKEEYSEAVLNYRCVLRSVTEHEGRLKTDDLQQLHALHNLHEILMIKPANVHPTLRDHQLHEQANDLRTKYMLKAENKVVTAQEALGTAQCSVKDTSDEYGREGEWWAQLLELMVQRELGGDLVLKVRDDIEGHANPGVGISMASSFRNIQGLEYCIYTQLSAMKSAREKLVKAVKKIRGKPTMDAVSETVGCCLRPAKETLRICPFCKTDELFNAYEAKIFSFRERGIVSMNEGQEMVHQVNTKRQGTWADSDVEKTLKSILNFCRHHGVPHHQKNLLHAGAAHIRHLEALKKEFKPLRAVWLAAREQVSAVDELDMATTRLRVRLQDEPQSEIPQPNVIERGQVAVHRMRLVGDKANAEVELRKKLGQLLYLTNLAKSQEGKDGNGSNPDPCPICQKALGVEWSVLLCGHCYCLDCIRIMVEQYSFGGRNRSLKCALCRQATHHSDISYVSTKKSAEEEEEDTIVIGSHSTKVKAVVNCIKKVCKEDPKAKALIFSTWHDVLDVIAKGLQQNNLAFRSLHIAGKFQQNLREFKEDVNITCLLIPLHLGSKGLNLIEATHVLLVEPILNPAEELQAIGRVHRIGQTKPTHIHKFLVRGTIEQRINNMVKSMSTSDSTYDGEDHTMTIGNLAALFAEVNTDGVTENPQLSFMDEGSFPGTNEPILRTSNEFGGLVSVTGSMMNDPFPGRSSMMNYPLAHTSSMMNDPLPGKSTMMNDPLPGTSSMMNDPLPHTSSMMNDPLPGKSTMMNDQLPGTRSMMDDPLPGASSMMDDPLPGTSSMMDDPLPPTRTDDPVA